MDGEDLALPTELPWLSRPDYRLILPTPVAGINRVAAGVRSHDLVSGVSAFDRGEPL